MKKVFVKQNIPNILLVTRIVLTVAVVVLLLIPNEYFQIVYTLKSIVTHNDSYTVVTLNYLLAGIFFTIACITDFLDGHLARKYNWVSDFGKLWDPIADKILINSVLICLAAQNIIPVWIPVIMIARDVAVDADRMVAASKNVVVAANIYGKLKTIFQMVAIIFVFFFCNSNSTYEAAMYWGIQNLPMYIACLLSIISGVIYFRDIHLTLKERNVQQH